jgi:hypothetical protein
MPKPKSGKNSSGKGTPKRGTPGKKQHFRTRSHKLVSILCIALESATKGPSGIRILYDN